MPSSLHTRLEIRRAASSMKLSLQPAEGHVNICDVFSQDSVTRVWPRWGLGRPSATEAARKEDAQALVALRGLLEQIQGENTGLKEQNAQLVEQCRTLSGRDAPHEEPPAPAPKRVEPKKEPRRPQAKR